MPSKAAFPMKAVFHTTAINQEAARIEQTE
jgi:hypothetical protein